VIAVVCLGLGIGIANWVAPGKVPLVVREVAARSGKLCMLLEGDDREACASVAAVASALALRKAPSGGSGGGMGGGAP
jgi:hypothetical protein